MCTRFEVKMAKNYEMQFETTDDSTEEGKVYHLYMVIMHTPTGIHTSHVLAESEELAKGQAECRFGYESYNTPKEVYDSIKMFVKQIPFQIRGWGKRTF